MITKFRIEYLSEEELKKPKVLQRPTAVLITLEGELTLVDAIVALLKTKYKMVY